MSLILKKRGRYLTGHSYATGFGYSYSWSPDISKARRFIDTSPYVKSFAMSTKATIIKVESTQSELREVARELMASRDAKKEPVTRPVPRRRLP